MIDRTAESSVAATLPSLFDLNVIERCIVELSFSDDARLSWFDVFAFNESDLMGFTFFGLQTSATVKL